MEKIKKGMTEAVTRDGRKVTQLTEFSLDDNESCLVGVLGNIITQWGIDGNYHIDGTHSNRDIFAPTEYEWQWLARQNPITDPAFFVTKHFKNEHEVIKRYSHCEIISRIEESKREVKQ